MHDENKGAINEIKKFMVTIKDDYGNDSIETNTLISLYAITMLQQKEFNITKIILFLYGQMFIKYRPTVTNLYRLRYLANEKQGNGVSEMIDVLITVKSELKFENEYLPESESLRSNYPRMMKRQKDIYTLKTIKDEQVVETWSKLNMNLL